MSATRASLVDDFSAMREVKSAVGMVDLTLFLEPLGRGIDVHTTFLFDCEMNAVLSI